MKEGLTRKSFWTAAAFYILIGLEFVYMAGPFAAYFYSLYGPGLNFFNETPQLAWLARFFMPHIVVETSSALVNLHNAVGESLAVTGFAGFLAGASQVYYHKLAGKGAVTGGVYRIVRHPQYGAFALCGLGLLLLWPRFIVLVMFITMLFGYYGLAKIEERECENKYGQSYRDYKKATAMFIPLPWSLRKLSFFPGSGWKRKVAQAILYTLAIAIGITAARTLETHSLQSLYTHSTADSLTLSLVKMDPGTLETIVATALSNGDVRKRLTDHAQRKHYLNYVLPSEWYVSEIPMETKKGFYHLLPEDYDRNIFKIILTRVELRRSDYVDAKEFLRHVTRRAPVLEVWVDIGRKMVTEIKDPPTATKYGNIPVAIY
ncbi:MAG: isoprenylcysteine carboxylmethyltransferase family protein [Desulfobacteraceae bacterium]|nr:MAG: isoprenylcysteine carboxylmethyltransferase family protein [Desulfobacteraceae bacterium]